MAIVSYPPSQKTTNTNIKNPYYWATISLVILLIILFIVIFVLYYYLVAKCNPNIDLSAAAIQ